MGDWLTLVDDGLKGLGLEINEDRIENMSQNQFRETAKRLNKIETVTEQSKHKVKINLYTF